MKKIILDCDPGIDDALAIILAINSDKISLEGITTIGGNSSVDQTTKNALRLLDYLEKDIPVVKGAEKPLSIDFFRSPRSSSVHGKDGLGDSEILPQEPKRRYHEDAVNFLIEKVKSSIRTIVVTGGLTNIALAFKKDPKTMNKLDELIIMGGVIYEAGNIDRKSEANFYFDPHAADYVLQQEVKIVLIPLDVTRKVIFTPKQRDNLKDTKTGKLIKSIVKKYQDFYINSSPFQGNPLHDPLAIGYAIDPSFVKTIPMDIKVETNGKYTRGVCIPELRARAKPNYNVNVALEVDSERFLDYFLETISK